MEGNLFGFIIGIIFIIAGLVFSTFIILNFLHNEKAVGWSTSKGEILISNLSKKVTRHSIGLDEFGPSTEVTYDQNIKFKYEVDNITYTSTKIYYLDYNNWFTTKKMKKNLDKIYKQGKIVTVYMNSNEVEKAFLIEKAPVTSILIYSLLCFLIGLFFLLG